LCPDISHEASLGNDEAETFAPAQLRRLPREERDRILREAAKKAESDYRQNLELTDFEAFSEEDLDVEDEKSQ
jgi:hypothetical protein